MPETAIPTPKPPRIAKSIYLETFGCQMNELDSELVRGHLRALGYSFIPNPEAADVILYNTCSVREQAENKVWSRLGIMGLRKKEGDQFVLGVIGCMAERDGLDMIRRFPQVDLMCGPGELDKLPMLIDNALKTEAVERADLSPVDRVALQGNTSRRVTTLEAANDNLELLDLSRAFDPDFSSSGAAGKSAYVRITRGCNKFCTYCVVPYTRGAEVHRPPDSIVDECRKLADQGVIEITLLGQTVNHYHYVHGTAVSTNGLELPQVGAGAKSFARHDPLTMRGEGRVRGETDNHSESNGSTLTTTLSLKGRGSRTTTFADLLKRIHDEVPAIARLRFVTSFPRDFGDDILHVMADSPRICRYLHVPAQSGSNRILKLMNRGYTVEDYIEFIDRARAILPDVCVAGDIIVGFPTETDEDFEQTKTLLRRVRHKNNFIFKYSPRPGTVAITRFADDVPEPVKRRRNNELLALQNEISAAVHAEFIGRTVNVFVDQAREDSEQSSAASHQPRANGSRVEMSPAASPRDSLSRGYERSSIALTISAKPPSTVPQQPRANGSPNERSTQEPRSQQLSGRTEGDLITVFTPPPGTQAEDFIGRIVPVHITASASLLLRGEPAL